MFLSLHVLQSWPVNPLVHSQVKSFNPSLHLPPFLQGFEEHLLPRLLIGPKRNLRDRPGLIPIVIMKIAKYSF